MKNKNPLYVIKGSNVLEAKNFIDLILKKYNLEPFVEVMMNIMKLILKQVTSYSAFLVVKAWVDDAVTKLLGFATRMGLT